MPDIEQIRELVRQTDYARGLDDPREPPQYADEVLVTQVPATKEWCCTARHGDLLNRYVVREEMVITPVASWGEKGKKE